MYVNKAIQYAAGKLPPGYEVEICIENGGYNVRLMSDDAPAIQLNEDSLRADIVAATDMAIEIGEVNPL